MLSISKIQLVVFAVVLILPALQSGGFLSSTVVHEDCMDLLSDCGYIECLLRGGGAFMDYNPRFCTLDCSGNVWPKVPDGVCRGDVEHCNTSTRESLKNWLQRLETTKNNVLESWCPSFWKK
uniref:Putative secreted salivary protein n=1 Tax=Ixodes scapularis TaxID=6945 RepID=Q4PMN5_IXOSC|nr:putative secreted salivary protein [Ixodes scapularis]